MPCYRPQVVVGRQTIYERDNKVRHQNTSSKAEVGLEGKGRLGWIRKTGGKRDKRKEGKCPARTVGKDTQKTKQGSDVVLRKKDSKGGGS